MEVKVVILPGISGRLVGRLVGWFPEQAGGTEEEKAAGDGVFAAFVNLPILYKPLEVVMLSAIALHPKHMLAQPVELDADLLFGRFSFTSGSFFNRPGQVIIAAVQDGIGQRIGLP